MTLCYRSPCTSPDACTKAKKCEQAVLAINRGATCFQCKSEPAVYGWQGWWFCAFCWQRLRTNYQIDPQPSILGDAA